MTRDEHKARAMLLGMEYMRTLGYYFKHNPHVRLDAVTLEVLPDDERFRRIAENSMGASDWYNEDDSHDEMVGG